MNPYGDDVLVDQVIGSAYQVVKFVAANMDLIIELADAMDTIKSVLEQLDSLIDSLPQLLELHTHLPELLALYANLTSLLALYAHIPEMSAIYDSLAELLAIYDNLPAILDSATSLVTSKEAIRKSYAEAGYLLVEGSFEEGGVLDTAVSVLLYEQTGIAYTGSGPFPQTVDPESTPDGSFTAKNLVTLRNAVTQQSGYLTPSANWANVPSYSDSVLGGVNGPINAQAKALSARTTLLKTFHNALHIVEVPGIDLSGTADNRAALYAVAGKVFIPAGMAVKCDLLPDDDVRKFVGEGTLNTTDPWGYNHVFSIAAMYEPSPRSDRGVLMEAAQTRTPIRVGILGDSITDGADAAGWTANPTDANGDLSSSGHDHSLNGGATSWFRCFTDNISFLAYAPMVYATAYYKPCNCASSGKRLADGWGYRNYDHGFFKNSAYGNRPPEVLYMALGYNDAGYTDTTAEMTAYRDELDKLICKAKGYGSAVALITLNTNDRARKAQEVSVKESAALKYGINFYDLSVYLDKYRRSGFETATTLWTDPGNTWDTTHPETKGHRFLGAAMTHATMSEMLIIAGEDVNHIPLTDTDFRNVTFPTKVETPVTQFKLSGGYLDQMDGWARIQPNENMTITYPVWCEDPQLSCIVFEPYHPTYTVAGRAHALKICSNDRLLDPINYTLASVKFPDHARWLATRIGNLTYGLNWVTLTYDGAPSTLYPPALLFRRSNTAMTIGKMTRFVSAGAEVPICLFGARAKILNAKFSAANGLDLMVDESNADNFDSLGWFTVTGIGAALRMAVKDGQGIQVTRISSTQVTVGLIGQAVLATVTGTFTNGFSVQINHEPSGSATGMRVIIYDDSLTVLDSRIVTPTNGVGGELSILNTTGAAVAVSVTGGYGYVS